MESFLTQHQAFLETIVLIMAITGPSVGLVLGYFRKRFSCIPKLVEEVEDERERSLRQSKGLIILAHRLDDINFDQHGKKMNLGPEMETILKDEKGNL